jgi:hypothetical protein
MERFNNNENKEEFIKMQTAVQVFHQVMFLTHTNAAFMLGFIRDKKYRTGSKGSTLRTILATLSIFAAL